MDLQDQIIERSREIQTDGYAMSIGEILSLYRDKEIDIHPEFQRIFRWKIEKKSRLIESILLGIPIPPIFVSQRLDGAWDVIDGVQRLSTIFEFMGEYREEGGGIRRPAPLQGTEYLSELEGVVWKLPGDADSRLPVEPDPESVASEDGAESVTPRELPEAVRRDFKRAKLELRIIKKGSDANAKYDLFDRLNSGAVLSQQESRNCLLVMLNVGMYRKLVELASSQAFMACTPLSDRQEEQSYRHELVLRFFAQYHFSGGSKEMNMEYGDYLTKWMRQAAPKFDTPETEFNADIFNGTFALLASALGEDSFRRWTGDRHLGGFSIASFEFVTTGVSCNLSFWEGQGVDALRGKIRESWSSNELREDFGTGISPRRRVPRLVNKSRIYFGPTSGSPVAG
jgi:hypothetical protein